MNPRDPRVRRRGRGDEFCARKAPAQSPWHGASRTDHAITRMDLCVKERAIKLTSFRVHEHASLEISSLRNEVLGREEKHRDNRQALLKTPGFCRPQASYTRLLR